MAGSPFDYISPIAGIGLQIAGGIKSYEAAKRENEYQQEITEDEMKQNAIRRQAMELSAQRSLMENARNVQSARAVALSNAAGTGAQFGSGLQGGLGQIAGQGSWNSQGITQNLEMGENMFNLSDKISQAKIGMSKAQSDYMSGQALSGFGSGVMQNMQAMANLGGNVYGGAQNMFANLPGMNNWGWNG